MAPIEFRAMEDKMNSKNNNRDKELIIAFYPVKHLCNLRCKYCVFLEKGHTGYLSSIDIFREMMEKIPQRYSKIKVLWYGGEFLLLGKKYFEQVAEITRSLEKKGQTIIHAGQTNCTLIDPVWVSVFRQLDFHVGLSIDFPLDLNKRRVWPDNKNATHDIVRGINLVTVSGLKYSVTTTVTKQSLGREQEIANQLKTWFLENIPHFFSPCYMGPRSAKNMFITGAEYAVFIDKITSLMPQRTNLIESIKWKNLCMDRRGCPKTLFVDWNGKWHTCSRTLNKEETFLGKNITEYRDSKAKNYIGKYDCSCLDSNTRTFWKEFINNYKYTR